MGRFLLSCMIVALVAGCAGHPLKEADQIEVYEQVLRRYLTFPDENPFSIKEKPGTVFVRDQAFTGASG